MAAPSSLQRIVAYLQGGPDAVETLLSGPKKSSMGEMAEGATKPKIDEKEVAEVAKVIAAEAANQGINGMTAVANTIANRSKNQGKSPLEVVSAKNQYYGYTAPNKEKLYKEVEEQALGVARKLYEGNLKDITGGAEFFLLPTEKIRKWHGDKTVTIGEHTFYKGAK